MAFAGDSIYWVEVEKVVPNPFQPRREFNESKLQELSESIRMYGVLQPLTVTRNEVQREDGTFYTQYELIAGERRLRASRLAGVAQVPVIIREGEDSEQEKLELAIIENLQREDLNAIDRALAFQQLADQFKMSHAQVGKKVGRSREYVANSIRLLQLPKHMQESLQRGELGEGHARTLLMLSDRPEEQETIFREVLLKKMSVRELERISRKIATDKVRKQHKEDLDEHLIDIEKEFTETLGTRVQIQKTDFGGKLTIDYFDEDDLTTLLKRVRTERAGGAQPTMAPQPSVSAPSHPVTAVQAPTPPQPFQPAVPTASVTPVAAAPVPAPPATTAHAHTTPSVTPAQPQPETPPTPAADPSLLQRLAAHTPLSFVTTTPQPAVEPEPQPMVDPVQTAVPPATPQQPVNPVTPPVQPQNFVSDTPMQDMPASPAEVVPAQPEQPPSDTDDDPDMYSLRNFTV